MSSRSRDTKYASEEEGREEAPRQRRSRKDKTKSKRKSKRSESEQGGGGPLGGLGGLGGLDGAGDTVSGLANGATGALGGIAGGGVSYLRPLPVPLAFDLPPTTFVIRTPSPSYRPCSYQVSSQKDGLAVQASTSKTVQMG
ncbi:predicted protein [Verticillium alfalfae VaMs.102]|uniref:Predicted protein n=1 Tax=Verticillium alfalfae (strain VaMs.102 / ATCC MYA-4576 / FGSC 10136) TaxID=526221 RepID=C9SW51_VERA1|nr:predicted protein [Verticillium alfalfae VaMs.102]EEY23016.1 predicted protein [Verticillium alfalfae VaMs.102]